MLERVELPSEEDMQGVSLALARIQFVYRYTVHTIGYSLYTGTVHKIHKAQLKYIRYI